MKNLIFIVTFTILSCTEQPKKSGKSITKDTINSISDNQKIENSKYYTTKDTLIIPTEIGDSLKFSKEEFNKIVDNHPEFYSEFTYNPDYLYHCYGDNVEFGSEKGQDIYYILYSYFLKQKNGAEKYASQRKTLIDIYNNINSLFGHFQYGGTYFAHQSYRIIGYAQYSIELYPKNQIEFEKTYDITKQKKLYLQSLRQLITDESKIDFETLGNEKIERTKKLNKLVDNLDKLITTNFFLRRAQVFQYENYEYY